MDKTRRSLVIRLATIICTYPIMHFTKAEQMLAGNSTVLGNFYYIYQNDRTRENFFQFLVNVFHLYPEKELHQLIHTITIKARTDKEVYQQLQNSLDDISPTLSNLRLALPALNKQKKVLTKQSQQLLGDRTNFNGYLEIGTTGRFIDALEKKLHISGNRQFIAEKKSSYSANDMVDRGQVLKAGKEYLLNEYNIEISNIIEHNSVDLVTVYIGFHHCPIHLREQFITGIRDVMTKDAVLLVRDHNAHNEEMLRTVSLAHDVFNMGTNESWQYNLKELRLFYSLAQLNDMMSKFGFKSDGRQLFQSGDPTKNALMAFTKA